MPNPAKRHAITGYGYTPARETRPAPGFQRGRVGPAGKFPGSLL
ncbi:MAG: hypothetical protein Q7V05_02965 [Methanoregula sp.]|nr:hypothetical protein [Methanoregula sp.]